ncbi:MAG TPA: CIA30 family protein, partial [Polyangiaceae bacterium]
MHRHTLATLSPYTLSLLACIACGNSTKNDPDPQNQGGGTQGIAGSAGTPTDVDQGGAAQAGSSDMGVAGRVAAGGSAGAATSAAAGHGSKELLVDDFEDGDDKPLITGGWFTYTDKSNGGGSILTMPGAIGSAIVANGEGYSSSKSLQVDYSFDQGTLTYAPYVGFGVWIGDVANPVDLSGYTGISYQYRGGAHRPRVEISDVTDYDQFGVELPASTSWKTVTLTFKDFTQEGWGKRVKFDASHTTALSFYMKGATGGKASLQIDNLKVVGGSTANATPDMTINPPAPPADATIASLEITNPLQAKAMAYLTRGYNITNWLEQDRFAGFTYDEAFIKKLAAAGWKSVRLPIDL